MNRILLAVTFLFSALALCADSLKLQLPEKIYAVPGIETNVYFDNIVLTPNSDFYVFDVDCRKGRNDQKRWRFVPTDKDVGEYDWNVKVMDGNGTLAEGKTKLIVSPANAGRGKRISILVVGDSLTNATVYPTRLFELTQGEKNPRLKMIGSNGPNRKPQKNGVAHEGWGGWAWKTFITKTAPYAKKDPKPWDVPSRFLVVKDGKGKLDFQAYLDQYNDGKAPDFITVQLGVNDIFGAKDENVDQKNQGHSPISRYSPCRIPQSRAQCKNRNRAGDAIRPFPGCVRFQLQLRTDPLAVPEESAPPERSILEKIHQPPG